MKIKYAFFFFFFFQSSDSAYEVGYILFPFPLVGKRDSLWRCLQLPGSLADHNEQCPLLPMLERMPKLKESLV